MMLWTLIVAWILTLFNVDDLIIAGINELFNTDFTIAVYWLIAFIIGAIVYIADKT